MDNEEKISVAASFALVLAGVLMLKFSGFASSSLVGLQNYIVKTTITSTSGMSTISAVYYFLSPFFLVVAGLAFFAAALAVIATRAFEEEGRAGIIVGGASLATSAVVFHTLWGVFLGLGLFAGCVYAQKIAAANFEEAKKWKAFRAGAKTVSRALFIVNVIVALGLFCSVLSAQSAYEASFRSELVESMKSIAQSIPGASALPAATLDQVVAGAIESSPLFSAYIRWLPVTAAVTAWFLLELLRNILLANLGGLFAYLLSKVSF